MHLFGIPTRYQWDWVRISCILNIFSISPSMLWWYLFLRVDLCCMWTADDKDWLTPDQCRGVSVCCVRLREKRLQLHSSHTGHAPIYIYRESANFYSSHVGVFCVCVCPWLTKWLTHALKASDSAPERNQYRPEKSTAVFGLGSLCCGRLPGWSSAVARVFWVAVSLLVIMSGC